MKNATRTERRKPLKLFVWENVLTDYTSGCMFALAHDVKGARSAVLKACNYVPESDLAQEPKVIRSVKGYAVWGGG